MHRLSMGEPPVGPNVSVREVKGVCNITSTTPELALSLIKLCNILGTQPALTQFNLLPNPDSRLVVLPAESRKYISTRASEHW